MQAHEVHSIESLPAGSEAESSRGPKREGSLGFVRRGRRRSRADEDFVVAVLGLGRVSLVRRVEAEVRTHLLDELCEPRDRLGELLVRFERLVHAQTRRSSRVADVPGHEDLNLRSDLADRLRRSRR